jgi:hypothetical protein
MVWFHPTGGFVSTTWQLLQGEQEQILVWVLFSPGGVKHLQKGLWVHTYYGNNVYYFPFNLRVLVDNEPSHKVLLSYYCLFFNNQGPNQFFTCWTHPCRLWSVLLQDLPLHYKAWGWKPTRLAIRSSQKPLSSQKLSISSYRPVLKVTAMLHSQSGGKHLGYSVQLQGNLRWHSVPDQWTLEASVFQVSETQRPMPSWLQGDIIRCLEAGWRSTD